MTPSPEGRGMVERVARVLARIDIEADAMDWPPGCATLEEVVEGDWPAWAPRARAAIEAMREPDGRMLDAAGKAMSPAKRPTQKFVSVKRKHKIRYQAMIDAALRADGEGVE